MRVVDTGGYDNRGTVSAGIHKHVEAAMQQADVVLFMVDAREGVNNLDESFAQWIRKKRGVVEKQAREEFYKRKEALLAAETETVSASSDADSSNTSTSSPIATAIVPSMRAQYHPKKVVIVANKCEGSFLNDRVMNCIADCLKLGLGDPMTISASHGDGMTDLASFLIQEAQARGLEDGSSAEAAANAEPIALEDRVIKLAIMGRPNVGKSSMLNAILGQERVITGPTPGLTR